MQVSTIIYSCMLCNRAATLHSLPAVSAQINRPQEPNFSFLSSTPSQHTTTTTTTTTTLRLLVGTSANVKTLSSCCNYNVPNRRHNIGEKKRRELTFASKLSEPISPLPSHCVAPTTTTTFALPIRPVTVIIILSPAHPLP